MKKIMLCAVVIMGLFIGGQTSALANDNDITTDDVFKQSYNIGRQKGIITDTNMSYTEFELLCRNSVFPAYLNAKQDDSTLTFQQFIADDHYEVPEQQPGDNPTTVRGNDDTSATANPMLRAAAQRGYKMKSGDILICYGTNSMGKYIGHAAIATSASYVLEMPGGSGSALKHNARHHTKKLFFQQHTGKGKYVIVYRIKAHPHYADAASTYAYRYMYKKDNPNYQLVRHLLVKSPSYCSKYVYLSYYRGATKAAVHYYNIEMILPHTLPSYFQSGSWKPSYIHKITSY